MKKFYSLSSHPGTTGQFFYNSFFKMQNLEAEYTPLAVANIDFHQTVDKLKNEKAAGFSISMPYKQKILDHLDYQSLDALAYNSCNTVVILNNKLYGYNTDLAGVIAAVSKITPRDKVIILGNGCLGNMFSKYMKILGYRNVKIVSRSLNNWNERHNDHHVLINCTSLGTVNNDSPVDYLSKKTRLVIDLAIKPGTLKEISKNINYFSGLDFYMHQFLKQYFIYTGRKITEQLFKDVLNTKL